MKRGHSKDENGRTRSAVLRVLQKDSGRRDKALAHEAAMSRSTLRRIRAKAKNDGTIKGVVTVLDRNKIGYPVAAFFKIVSSHFRSTEAVAESLKAYPGVQELHVLDGTHYLLAKICSKTPQELSRIQQYILTLKDVQEVRFQVAMRTILETTRLPV